MPSGRWAPLFSHLWVQLQLQLEKARGSARFLHCCREWRMLNSFGFQENPPSIKSPGISDKTRCQICLCYKWVQLRGILLNYSISGFDLISRGCLKMWDEVMSGALEKRGKRHYSISEYASAADSHDYACLRNMLPAASLKYLLLLRSEEEILIIITSISFFVIEAYSCSGRLDSEPFNDVQKG